jgi:hypothetical protein
MYVNAGCHLLKFENRVFGAGMIAMRFLDFILFDVL